MTDAMKSRSGRSSKNDELLLLQMVERFNLILLALLTAGGWYFVDWLFSQSVLVGGALSSGSFFWMKRTAMRFAHHAATQGDGGQINGKSFSTGFAVKFYARLFVLAFLLLLLNTQFSMNAIGLVIGLSTVILSVIIVVLFRGRMIFQENM
ncbi:ATP synthase I chain [Candidatus Electrothrix aarhusensis]|uniref:ATP synthase I chain n=1 Tax=Candidatus Electrothrix aarhusensis TaxID=1859131 RepID=A0A3S3QFZ6_9BACT|nr:ATP synthase I chain [Candidatus Electrothrix aarhusensis]